MKSPLAYLVPLLGVFSAVGAIDLDLNSQDSVKNVLASLAYDMLLYYNGNTTGKTPGILPGPCQSVECYYWWQAGAMWGGLINYWQYTGDDSYQPTVLQALQFQIGPNKNYNPPNQSKNMGVDDQDFWGFAAMEAAEAGIPDTAGDFPSWLALAQAVFNFQVGLWDADTCGGGFRWQVYSINAGYNLKNTISNGGFFQLAARLARYTGNATYAEWAVKTWDWMASTPLFSYDNGVMYIWDNTDANKGCIDVQNFVWSYNHGTMLMGAAMLYNYTNGSALWQQRVQDILNGALHIFFPQEFGGGEYMVEYLCDNPVNCNNDQSSFKAYLSRWMAVTSLIAPFTAAQIKPKLLSSAAGAAKQCIGGANGRKCGRQWYSTVWDGTEGVGQQMSAMSVIGATQITEAMAPLTATTGGNSKSDPIAGIDAPHNPLDSLRKITTADRAGAAILSIMAIVFVVGLSVWIVL